MIKDNNKIGLRQENRWKSKTINRHGVGTQKTRRKIQIKINKRGRTLDRANRREI